MSRPAALPWSAAIFLIGVSVGLGAAALAGAGVAWDGAAFLFRILDDRDFTIYLGRWSNLIVQSVPVGLSRVTDNVHAVVVAYGLALGLIRVVGLALAWHVLRRTWPQGFVWPALAFAWATVPGEFLMQCEAQEAMALAWPVLLALLLDPARHKWLICPVSVFLFFLHPVSVGVFLLFSIAAFARRKPTIAVMFLLVSAARLWLLRSGYESNELSLQIIRQHFDSSAGSRVRFVVAGSWLAGLGMLAVSTIAASEPIKRAIAAVVLLVLGFATCEAVLWAMDVHAWADMEDFRTIVPFAAGPLFVLAVVDAVTSRRHERHGFERPAAIALAGLTFVLVFSVQAAGWRQVTAGYLTDLRGNPKGCVDLGLLEGTLRRTPLWNHTAPVLAILLQGRRPDWLVASSPGCGNAEREIALAPWYSRPVDHGWFDLTAARRFPSTTCSIAFRDGWYGLEAAGADRWQWTAGRGTLEVDAPASDYPLAISGIVLSLPQPNVVRLAMGDTDVGRISTAGFRTVFGPLTLSTPADRVMLTFVSEQPGAVQAHDPRSLAAALANLVVVTRTGARCAVAGG